MPYSTTCRCSVKGRRRLWLPDAASSRICWFLHFRLPFASTSHYFVPFQCLSFLAFCFGLSSGYLAYVLAFYLAYLLTFFLAYLLAFSMVCRSVRAQTGLELSMVRRSVHAQTELSQGVDLRSVQPYNNNNNNNIGLSITVPTSDVDPDLPDNPICHVDVRLNK